MKKLKISDSDLRLLLLLFALIIIACAYFFGFNNFNQKAADIEEQNKTNQVRLDELRDMVARQAEVEEDTKNMQQRMTEIIAKYPSKITTEKMIANIQQLESNTGLEVSQMSFTLNNQFSDVVAAEVLDTTDESSGEVVAQPAPNNNYYGSFASVMLNYEADYDTLKRAIDEINHADDKMSITTLAASYSNEDNKLMGTMTLYMYTLGGTGKPYENPEVSDKKGVSNIFRSGNGSQSTQNVASQNNGNGEVTENE